MGTAGTREDGRQENSCLFINPVNGHNVNMVLVAVDMDFTPLSVDTNVISNCYHYVLTDLRSGWEKEMVHSE